jgi:hypothetical protein
MPVAAPLPVAPDDLAQLRRWVRASQLPAVLVQRARILLLAAAGMTNTGIAERVGVSRPTVLACRRRYLGRGLDGLAHRPRPGALMRRSSVVMGRHLRGWSGQAGRRVGGQQLLAEPLAGHGPDATGPRWG